MFQIKIFRFTINNRTCSDVEDDKRMMWFDKEAREVTSEEEIEEIINDFLATHNVINIQTNTFTCRKNDDRLRDDDVDILYTITYEIEPKEYLKMQEELRMQKQAQAQNKRQHENVEQRQQEKAYPRPNNAAIPVAEEVYSQPESLNRKRNTNNCYYGVGNM